MIFIQSNNCQLIILAIFDVIRIYFQFLTFVLFFAFVWIGKSWLFLLVRLGWECVCLMEAYFHDRSHEMLNIEWSLTVTGERERLWGVEHSMTGQLLGLFRSFWSRWSPMTVSVVSVCSMTSPDWGHVRPREAHELHIEWQNTTLHRKRGRERGSQKAERKKKTILFSLTGHGLLDKATKTRNAKYRQCVVCVCVCVFVSLHISPSLSFIFSSLSSR